MESLSTFAAFTALFDNYKPSPSEVEEQTEEELAEEARFLEEVTATEVMRTTYQFLVDRGNNKHGLSHIDRVSFLQYINSHVSYKDKEFNRNRNPKNANERIYLNIAYARIKKEF